MKSKLAKKLWSPLGVVVFFSFIYFLLFSAYSLERYNMLWTSYFDLGIMHQATFNSYKAITELDISRLLEITDPHGTGHQAHRGSVHADYLLAILSIFYFIHSGPQTLLFIQTLAIASGAIAIHLISCAIIKPLHCHPEFNSGSSSEGKIPKPVRDDNAVGTRIISVILPVLYLMNFAVQRTNVYEFHAVTMATPLILWMYLFYLRRNYKRFLLMAILAIITKEQVGLSIGIFLMLEGISKHTSYSDIWKFLFHKDKHPLKNVNWSLVVAGFICIIYVFVTIFWLMPNFRNGDAHFAITYFTTSSNDNPILVYLSRLFNWETLVYLVKILAPLAFVPILSPIFLVAVPDLLINILSSSDNMRNFYYHYTAVITPWIFIAGISGFVKVIKEYRLKPMVICTISIFATLYISFIESPLPYSQRGGGLPVGKFAPEIKDVKLWQEVLASDSIKVSASGHLAPQFSGRRYFYNFGKNYNRADYVVIRKSDLGGYSENDFPEEAYERLVSDDNFVKIYSRNTFEVYKKVSVKL